MTAIIPGKAETLRLARHRTGEKDGRLKCTCGQALCFGLRDWAEAGFKVCPNCRGRINYRGRMVEACR